jgi:hypothetical protein
MFYREIIPYLSICYRPTVGMVIVYPVDDGLNLQRIQFSMNIFLWATFRSITMTKQQYTPFIY